MSPAADAALAAVQARFPHRAGTWFVNPNGPDLCVTHRYHGRRRPTVEVYVRPDGTLETLDGQVIA